MSLWIGVFNWWWGYLDMVEPREQCVWVLSGFVLKSPISYVVCQLPEYRLIRMEWATKYVMPFLQHLPKFQYVNVIEETHSCDVDISAINLIEEMTKDIYVVMSYF